MIHPYENVSQEYIRGNCHWIARLSDGREVYQHHDDHTNTWIDLKEYCKENNLFVTSLKLLFRDHVEELPTGHDGYYFVHSLLSSFIGYEQFFYVIGYLHEGKIYCTKYVIPELVPLDSDVRDPEDAFNKESLICKQTLN